MKAAFTGYYGMQNAGDDAFLEVVAWGAQAFWSVDDVLFYSPILPELQHPARQLNAFATYGRFIGALRELFSADVFVSAGGSTFHSALHKTDLRTYGLLKKRFGFGGQLGAIGISLGPYSSVADERDTINYLQRLDFLALRDTQSYEMALGYNLPYRPVQAFDLAALLPDVPGVRVSCSLKFDGKPTLGISVCNYESYTHGDLAQEQQRNRFIQSLLLELASMGDYRYRFFVFNGHAEMGDEALTREMIGALLRTNAQLDYEIVPYEAHVARTFSAIAQCQAMLSTRLHASIFACYAGVPFFLMEYHRKCSDFLDDVGQHPDYRLADGDVPVQAAAQTLAAALNAQQVHRPQYLEETRARALLNFTATFRP
ncbi:MAG: polysaccharide pyruvyl transferase family protein [Bacteroidia bacterium]